MRLVSLNHTNHIVGLLVTTGGGSDWSLIPTGGSAEELRQGRDQADPTDRIRGKIPKCEYAMSVLHDTYYGFIHTDPRVYAPICDRSAWDAVERRRRRSLACPGADARRGEEPGRAERGAA